MAKRLNDKRPSVRAPFEISTSILLVSKAFSYFFDLIFIVTWTGHDDILYYKFSIVNWNRNRNLHLYAETGSLEFTNICSTHFKTLSLISRNRTNHRLIITEDCKCFRTFSKQPESFQRYYFLKLYAYSCDLITNY